MITHYLSKHRASWILFLLLSAASAVLYARLVLNVSKVFDFLMAGEIEAILPFFTLLFFALLLIRLMDYWADALAVYVFNHIRLEMKQDLFRADIHRSGANDGQRDSRAYIADYTNDITMLEAKGLCAVRAIASNLVSILTFSLTLASINLAMLLPVVINGIVSVFIPLCTGKRTSEKMNQFLSSFDELVKNLDDYFRGFSMLKTFGIENEITRSFSAKNQAAEAYKFQAEKRIETIHTAIHVSSWMMQIAIVVIGFWGVLNRGQLIGTVIAAYTLAVSLCGPLQSIVRSYNEICSVNGVKNKLSDALKFSTQTNDAAPVKKCPEAADITLDNVCVDYDGNRALSDVSVCFEKGRKYLIIGENGSGKTTLTNLLTKNVLPSGGKIFIGDQELTNISADQLSALISYSGENVALFSDTVERNVTLYQRFDSDCVRRAVEKAHLNVPLDRIIGDDGISLSGGEKRKLETARSLLHNAPILVFDEVVSTLDIRTAYEVEELILSIPDRTVIMVSNAFSGKLLSRYDQIVVMEKGKILNCGTHEQLMACCGKYRTLYQIRCGLPAVGAAR